MFDLSCIQVRMSTLVDRILQNCHADESGISAGAGSRGWLRFSVMKAPTVFLGELTNSELESWLEKSSTVIIPVGAVEQHGPHSAMLTDVIIPTEIARRVAPRLEALVAPPVSYALSYPHTGFRGVAQIRIPTFMALIED